VDDDTGQLDEARVTADLHGAVKDQSVRSSNNFTQLNSGKPVTNIKLAGNKLNCI
jgi:hypothetical protein